VFISASYFRRGTLGVSIGEIEVAGYQRGIGVLVVEGERKPTPDIQHFKLVEASSDSLRGCAYPAVRISS